MATVNDVFVSARALLDEYTDDGVVIPDSEIIDMQKKAIILCDMAHKELYEISRLDEDQDEPTDLTLITDELEVNYKAIEAIKYYVASKLAMYENKSLIPLLEVKFEMLKNQCRNKATIEEIEDVYEG